MTRGDRGKRPRSGGRGGGGGGYGDNKKAKFLPKGSSNSIPIGSRGFLVSCVAGKEQEAGREIVDALEEEYERMATEAAKEERRKKKVGAGNSNEEEKTAGASSSSSSSSSSEEEEDEQERELDAGADFASALAAEITGLKGHGSGGEKVGGDDVDDDKQKTKRKKKGLRFHVLGLPGLVYVSGAGSAAISAAEAAAAAEMEAAGAGAGATAAAAAAGGDDNGDAAAAASPSSSSPQQLQGPLPSDVARSLCSRIREERAGTTRFCLRLLPADEVVFVGGGGGGGGKSAAGGGGAAEAEGAAAVADATKATATATAKEAATVNAARAITEGLRPLLARHFAAPAAAKEEEEKERGGKGKGSSTANVSGGVSKTFAVAYEKRASTANLERNLVIDAALAALPRRGEGEGEGDRGGRQHGITVDLDDPDVTALIQVVKGAAALSAVRDYKGLLKLNLRELAAPGSTAAADNARRGAKVAASAAAVASKE